MRAIEELITEEDISELLVLPSKHGQESEKADERQWAVLPQLGYGPDSGPVVGAKFTDRDIYGSGMTLDLDGTYAALNSQEHYGVKLNQPHLANDQFLVTLFGKYRYDPEREFFGLGNNRRGPAPAATYEYQDIFGVGAIGWRPIKRVSLNFSVMVRDYQIGRGSRKHSACGGVKPCPFLVQSDGFPNLPGIKGGNTNPFSLSLVYNGRDEIVRPTQGWRVILKVSHTNTHLLSDYEFTRLIGDAGYLYPFFDKRVVVGLRGHALWMDGPPGKIPFWELADLGGADTLRGFFPRRFLGERRLLANLEVRGLLTEFDFYRLWHVRIDGVVFGEGGRVFLERHELANEYHAIPQNTLIRNLQLVNHVQYSYGGGVRIALSSALVARLDVGFSDEEKGLFYLTFGQTF